MNCLVFFSVTKLSDLHLQEDIDVGEDDKPDDIISYRVRVERALENDHGSMYTKVDPTAGASNNNPVYPHKLFFMRLCCQFQCEHVMRIQQLQVFIYILNLLLGVSPLGSEVTSRAPSRFVSNVITFPKSLGW